MSYFWNFLSSNQKKAEKMCRLLMKLKNVHFSHLHIPSVEFNCNQI